MWRNEMIREVFIVIILVSYTVSDGNIDGCVRYTFEEKFNEWFTDDWDQVNCESVPFWMAGKYSDLARPIDQNDHSTTFIRPLEQQSCLSSFIFTMHYGGTIEVRIYMEHESPSNSIIVFAYLFEDGPGDILGNALNMANNQIGFVVGWHTLKITLTREGSYAGFISIMGMASPNSIVLVDSFRYIPPGMKESECQLYEEDQTTESSTEDSSTESSTEDQSTESSTEDSSTESSTEDQSTESSTEDASTGSSTEDQSTESSTEDQTTESSTEDQSTESSTEDQSTESSTEDSSTESSSEDPSTESSTEEQTTESSSEEQTTELSTDDPITESSTEEQTTESSTKEQTTESSTAAQTTESATEDQTTEELTTQDPTQEITTSEPTTLAPIGDGDTKGFWTALTITMVILLSLIVLALICLLFYELGRRRAKAAAARAAVDNDGFEDLPSAFRVPRVRNAYSDANPLSRSSAFIP